VAAGGNEAEAAAVDFDGPTSPAAGGWSLRSTVGAGVAPAKERAKRTMYAVEATGLGKSYRVFDGPWDRLREALGGSPRHRPFHALRDVSFALPRGQALGVIGENGAGKSTLLKILAGVTRPSTGSLRVDGKVAAILELGSGFHPDFTGRQNIALNATVLGLTADEVRRCEGAIVEFAELGAFIDQPVKTYSTGMAMRLGFAIATQVEPDVLIVDEALSVGDGYFAKKCVDRMQQLLAGGTTLLFCSHAMYYVSAFCARALWLRGGEVAAHGATAEVVRAYEEFLQAKEAATPGGAASVDVAASPARFTAVGLQSPARPLEVADGAERALSIAPGDPLEIEVTWESRDPELAFHLGVGLNRLDEVEVASFSSLEDGLAPWTGAQSYRATLALPRLPLVKGAYKLYLFLLDGDGIHVHDRRILPRAIIIQNPDYRFGLVDIDHRWIASLPVVTKA
jgi:lipopolysaccharide transport system ATP-binding protein